MIVIGGSLGGMAALRVVLGALPVSFAAPIAVVLHRHREADSALVELLGQDCSLPLAEVWDKEPIQQGHVYIAPADYHLLVERTCFSLSIDERVQYARPSIDVLFESAADAFGPAVTGVILTGANHDGAQGAAFILSRKGRVIIQDPATAECPVMPMAALEATSYSYACPLEQIGALLVNEGPRA